MIHSKQAYKAQKATVTESEFKGRKETNDYSTSMTQTTHLIQKTAATPWQTSSIFSAWVWHLRCRRLQRSTAPWRPPCEELWLAQQWLVFHLVIHPGKEPCCSERFLVTTLVQAAYVLRAHLSRYPSEVDSSLPSWDKACTQSSKPENNASSLITTSSFAKETYAGHISSSASYAALICTDLSLYADDLRTADDASIFKLEKLVPSFSKAVNTAAASLSEGNG